MENHQNTVSAKLKMGRINLTPLRVRQRALANLETKRTNVRPQWLDVVGDIPPAQIFIRQQAVKQPRNEIRTRTVPFSKQTQVLITPARRHQKKSYGSGKRLFQPAELQYEEDEIRERFFRDHPWELARPRVVLEREGQDIEAPDYSRVLGQQGKPVTGEDVVQRTVYLLQTVPDVSEDQAYDKARKEFYDLRRQEDIQRRIAAEEAEHTGAQFGPSILQWSMNNENKQYDNWEEWSRKTVVEQMQRNAAFAGQTMNVEEALTGETIEPKGPGSDLFAQEQARQSASGRRVIA